ncbi:E3 ubiquitin--protein ligase [Halovivax gelatinilyticus]|uniref:E3 ubiquitin--protein ligase n=1 Tax=Halovivax gelatinilyticus TaxID=2961597 RepID=UPI0020CA3648|nr:E3 ubiquitin--protein ligase [Halovivax gelatinilyticus]
MWSLTAPPAVPATVAAAFWVSLLVLAVAVASAVALYGLRELRLAHLILRTETDSVLETPNGGYVELRGTVEPAAGALESPFTGTACVAYEYAVEEERSSKNGSSWTTISAGDEYVPFRLDDGSGSVLVEPPGADFRLDRDDRIRVDGGTEPPARIGAYIDWSEDVDCQNESVDLRLFELRTGSDRRFIERRLDVGDEAHVLGYARFDTDVGRAAGQVNAAVGVGESSLADDRFARLRHRLFGFPFVVSDRSERRLGLYTELLGFVLVAAGAGVVAVCLWLLCNLVLV